MSEERRQHPRYSVEFPVQLKVRSTREVHEGVCLNLSSKGILVETDAPLARGEDAVVDMVLPSIGKAFNADARVVWNISSLPERGRPGLGFQFTDLSTS